MKKIKALLLLILISVAAFGQTKVNKGSTQLTIPKGSILFSKSMNKEKLKSKFQMDTEVKIEPADNDYEIDGMQLSIFYHNNPIEKDYIETMKASIEGRRKRFGLTDPYYLSEIITVKGNRGLLTRDKGSAWSYYTFYIENSDLRSSVSGILKYVNGEEGKAKQKVDELVASVQFTK